MFFAFFFLQYSAGHQASVIPKIQVQNDQYRPPEPQYPHYVAPPQQQFAPPPQHYAPPQPQYMYPPTQQPVMYEPTPQETYHHPQSRLSDDANLSVFQRTITNDVQPPQQSQMPVKRRSTGEPVEHTSLSSGPLRSSSKNYVPIIHTTGSSATTRTQKPKFSKITAPGEPSAKKIKEEVCSKMLCIIWIIFSLLVSKKKLSCYDSWIVIVDILQK